MFFQKSSPKKNERTSDSHGTETEHDSDDKKKDSDKKIVIDIYDKRNFKIIIIKMSNVQGRSRNF